jgi:antitoxin HicB
MTTKRDVKVRSPGGELARYLSAPYVRMIIPNAEEGGYLAEVLELPGCITEGDTPEEAYRNLQDAMEGWFAASLDTKRPIPEPVGDHFPLRMSTELHRLAALRAMQEGISLNQWIVRAIAAQVAKQNLAQELGDYLLAKWAERMSVNVATGVLVQFDMKAPGPSDFIEPRVPPATMETSVATPEPVLVSWRQAHWKALMADIQGRKEVDESA